MIVGRDQALHGLQALADRLGDGAQVTLITGGEGVGKSALAAAAAGPRAHTVELYPDDANEPLAAARDLASHLGATLGDDPAHDLLRALESAGDVRIVIEDAQWMDDDSQRLLWQVLRRFRRLPAWFLITSTSTNGPLFEGVTLLVRSPERGSVIHLEPLGEEAVAEFLKARLGIRIEGATLRRVVASTGGYPAQLVSLTDQLPHSAAGTSLLSAIRSLTSRIDDTGLLSRQAADALDSSSASTRAALIAVAQAGELNYAQLSRVLSARSLPPVSVDTLLGTGLVDRHETSALRIRHSLAQQAVIDRADWEEQRATHSALGETLDGLASLEHLAHAAEGDQVAPLLNRLGSKIEMATLQGDLHLAFRLAKVASGLDASFLINAFLSAVRVGHVNWLSEIAPLIANQPAGSVRACALALLDLDHGDLNGALERVLPLDPRAMTDVRELIALGNTALQLSAHAAMLTRPEMAASFDPLIDALRERALAEPPFVAYELTLLAYGLEMMVRHILSDKPPADRIAPLLALREEVRHLPGGDLLISGATAGIGMLEFAAGNLDAAVEEITAPSVSLIPMLRMQTALALILIRFLDGMWDEAYSLADQQLASSLDDLQSSYWQQSFALGALVPACRGEGQVMSQYLGWQKRHVVGSLADACRCLVMAWESVSREGITEGLIEYLSPLWSAGLQGYVSGHPTAVLLTAGYLARGDRPAAKRLRSLLDTLSYEEHAAAYTAAHCEALIAADKGDLDAAADHLMAARSHLEAQIESNPRGGLRLFQVLLVEDRAALAARTGVKDASFDADLGTVRGLLAQCGAAQWLDRIKALDAGDVPSPPQGESSVLSLLTTREREIALLVAEGLSNREIAERLFVTVRTAEYHVHNALTKAGFRSRVALRSALNGTPSASA